MGFLIASPVFILICLLLLYEFGSILFVQERVGYHENGLKVYKFQTMKDGTKTPLADDTERATPTGLFLREYQLDELPQLWNVLVGNMSMVGPRPIWTQEYRKLKEEYPCWTSRQRYLPGLFDPAVAKGYDNTDEPIESVRIQHKYLENWSLRNYFSVIFGVLRGVFNESN
jgi:lipopolysaccharide/colanic/teichoic acid biosynthesis glycosyltransferase